MHELLSLEQRIRRARRRLGEIAVWRVAETKAIGGWTLDDAPIAVGAPWPSEHGVHVFEGGPFEAPVGWPLDEVRLSLDVSGESLLTIAYDGGPTTTLGLDPNHNEFPLDARKGRLSIEAVARSAFGQAVPDPRFRRAELRRIEPALDLFVATAGHAVALAQALGEHELSPLLIELVEDAMTRFRGPTRTLDVVGRVSPYAQGYGGRDEEPRTFAVVPLDEAARASFAPAQAYLNEGLRALKERFPPHGAVAYVGHAHIDTAWLWPIEETRRKVRRTFSTVVDLLKRYPGFHHAQSFAEYYRGLEDDDPALLGAVREQAASGRWAPAGGLWVEPDINMPCGESLVRQALYGQLYFERVFGRRHTCGWLPDTFGFSGALPQILKGAGLASLFTIKIGWSETNRFPHTRFWWEGIDGSRVLVQMFNRPEDTYNGLVDPGSLLRAWRTHADKRFAPEVLQPIGHGDGGGGPTAQMIASQAILADFPLLPSTRWTTPEAYFDRAMEEALQTPLATWVGELYLEFHRGVLTSQGRTKRLHRQAERGLVAAEALAGFAALLGGPQPAPLAEAWRVLMINQFHDILPGSSITDVYVRTERELGDVVGAADAAQAAALDAIASRMGTSAGPPGLLIVNPDLNERPVRLQSIQALPGGQPAEEGFVLASEARVPALGALSGRPAPASGVSVEPRVLENAFVRIEVGDDGALASMFDKRVSREVLAGRGNQIWAYHDQPREYDAWDVEGDYQRSGEEVAADSIEIVESGPQRGALRIFRRVRSSTIVQSVRLWANSARLDFATRFDWRDRRLLLKARFPLAVRADYATFECAFGVCRRPTHVNTSWDAAKFEVPAHRFVDLSEPGYGVALLNDGRYGCHARGAELGLSLLRSPILPDRLADEGEQALTYALLPHPGDWIAGGVLAEAEDLNRSLPYARVDGAADDKRAFLSVAGQPVALGALKPAEDGDGLVLRVYEPSGARGPIAVEPPPGWRVAGEVSLLEDPIEPPAAVIRPFEIRSFRLRRA
ncbi:MAG TPA: glycoside hydrolase family 38 C-terminal domain-containing protein [Caulobacteraceae bacterium]|nr:glycoside hydrolase family 38 C-terminal domain-containing protein [Caulobacteraceae bacterium]